MLRLKQFALILLLLGTPLFASKGIEKVESYNKNSDLQWQWAMSAIEKYAWRGDERLLDVGSGDGKVTAILAKKLPQGIVVGLDISEKMIDYATSRFKPALYPHLLFVQGNASSLPFKDQFDIVASFCALHWVLDQQAALRGIHESLVSGGRVLLVTPGASPNNLSTQVEKLVLQKKWAPLFPNFAPQRAYFTRGEYEKLLVEAGLVPLMLEESRCETPYPNKAALIDWLRPLATFIRHLPEEKQGEFLSDLADAMLKIDPPAADGSICIHYNKLEILAIKP